MDVEYYKTIRYYIECIAQNENVNLEHLSRIIVGCPLEFFNSYTTKEFQLTYSKNNAITIIDSKSFTTISLGVCYFLALTRWKFASDLIKPLISTLNSKITSETFSTIPSYYLSKERFIAERMIWNNFCIIPTTLYSYAATLTSQDPLFEIIIKTLTSFWLRIAKYIIKAYNLSSSVFQNHSKIDYSDNDSENSQIKDIYSLWYVMALAHVSIGIYLALECEDLARFIIEPPKYEEYAEKAMLVNIEPSELIIKAIGDLLNDNLFKCFGEKFVKCKLNPFEGAEKRHIFITYISGISFLNCRIGKYSVSKGKYILLKLYILIIVDLFRDVKLSNTRILINLVENKISSQLQNQPNIKLNNLSDIVYFEDLHLDKESREYSRCLIENTVLLVHLVDGSSNSDVEELLNLFLKKYKVEISKNWPIHRSEVFCRLAYLRGMHEIIAIHSHQLNKIQTVNNITNTLLNHSSTIIFIGLNTYSQMLGATSNTLAAFTNTYFKEDQLSDQISFTTAFYFYYCQRLILMLFSCLETILDHIDGDKNEVISQTIAAISYPLLEYTRKFRNINHAKTSRRTIKAIMASQALSYIGSKFSHVDGVFDSTFSLIHQCFMRPVSLLDRHLVNLMVFMMLSKQNSLVYTNTIDTFRTLILSPPTDQKGDSSLEDFLEYPCTAIINTFNIIASNLKTTTHKISFMENLLEIFIQICLCFRRYSNIFVNYLPSFVYQVIRSISTITNRIHIIPHDSQKIQRLFRNFWVCIVIIGSGNLGVYSQEILEFYQEISIVSPPLVAQHLRSELQYTISIEDNSLDQTDMSNTRSMLMNCLECNTQSEIASLIARLPVLHVVFLTAIFEQESLAVEKNTSRFPHIFDYLEDIGIERDKNKMATVVEFTCDKIFGKFINTLVLRTTGYDVDKDLTSHITILLVKFNSEMKRVQRAADKYLSMLINKFPHMLWNSSVVRTMLDFMQILKVTSNSIYNDCVSITIIVPHTNFKYTLPDTKQKRDEIIVDYQSRCDSLISEASRCAPIVITAILLEYLMENRLSFKVVNNHFGIELLMSSIISAGSVYNSNVNIRIDTNSYESSLNKNDAIKKQIQKYGTRQDVGNKNINRNEAFVSNCTYIATCRSHYLGKIEGLLATQIPCVYNNQSYYPEFEGYILRRFSQQNQMKQDELDDFIMLVTSYICFTKRFVRRIIFQLCNICIHNFSLDYMKLAIESWQWIFSSCKQCQISLLSAICLTWESTFYKQFGLFDFKLKSNNEKNGFSGSHVHDIWIQFLIERYDVSKFYSPFQVKLIAQSICESIKLILKAHPDSSYIEANCVPFLRLVSFGLKLLQNKFLSNTFRRVEMREKILKLILLYFSSDIVWPKPAATEMSLEILKSVAKLLSSDRKFQTHDNPDNASIATDSRSYVLSIPSNDPSRNNDARPLNSSLNLIFRKSKTSLKTEVANSETLNSFNTIRDSSIFSDSKSYGLNYHLQFLGNESVSVLRTVLLNLCYREIERLSIWLNPTDKTDYIAKYIKNCKASFLGKNYHRNLNIFYSINPKAAVMLIKRLSDIQTINRDISNLIRANPARLISVGFAVKVFWLQGVDVPNPVEPVKSLILIWAKSSIDAALEFLSPQLQISSIYTTQYAISCFKNSPIDMVLFYIPQLVQCLRHDTWSYIESYIQWISQRNNLISHQFIWNMKTSIYMDEESTIMDPVLGEKLKSLIEHIVSNFNKPARDFYEKEFTFFTNVTRISGTIKPFDKASRRKVCQEELAKINPQFGVYLPTNPDCLIVDIDYTSGIPMQSAAKAPFLARFKVCICNTETVEKVNVENNIKLDLFEESSGAVITKAVIFKVGDDVRQDMLALQIISIFKNVFQQTGIGLNLYSYKVVATAPGCGVIECVPNAKSRDQLGKQTDASLDKYYSQKYGDESSVSYKKARECFTSSFAAFCIVSYVLQVKDRHNGNIMIIDEGYITHIDFGFLFESSPGGNMGFEPDMKITTELLNILGGSIESTYFKNFLKQAIKGYLVIRQHESEIVNIVALMLESNLPCFRSETIRRLRYRLSANLSEKDASQFFEKVINDSCQSIRTVVYDYIQKAQNEIPC